MTAPPDQATAGWSRLQRRWIGSVPTQDSDRGCSEWAVQQTGCAGGIAHIQACAAWARHGCFGSRGCSGLAMPLPRTHASRHTTRTTGSSRPCDRRPARDRVGDPRCCSRWGCNSGPERKPAHGAIVGAGRQPSLLSGISDRQLPVDGAVRMPRIRSSGLRSAYDPVCGRLACESPRVVSPDRAHESKPSVSRAWVSALGCQLGSANSWFDGAVCAAGRSLPEMSLAFALMAAINGSTGSWATLSHGL